MDSDRWVEVSPSQFTHEAEGLRLVKELLPDVEPFRAWSNFEFRDTHGRWHEVDLAVLGRDTLYLVELKYYSGTLRGDDHRWLRGKGRAEDSPLKLTHRKAQYFASLLKERLREFARERGQHRVNVREIVPYVQEAVFLHHENLRCELPQHARKGIYGLEGHEETSGLTPLSELLLAPARQDPITEKQSRLLAGLMREVGLVPRRQREAGSWVIDDEPLGEGEGWQDWPAFHRVTTTDRSRIRFYMAPPGTDVAEERRLERKIEHEYRLLSQLRHDSVLAPRDLVKAELGIGLVYPHDERLTRLDLWFAERFNGLSLRDQLTLLRDVAEALHYAHRHRVVHRRFAPSAVYVRDRTGGGFAVVVKDWEAAGSVPTGNTSHLNASVTGDGSSLSPLGGTVTDEDDLFEAPEGRWTADADRVKLDVFGLGAVAYYILTGQRLPAQDRGALVERLRRDGGLDLAADLPQVPSLIRDLVLHATSPRPSKRTSSVAAFLEQLDEAEKALYEDTVVDDVDPLDASPGALLGGRYEFVRRLGSGSTAVGLLVKDQAAGGKSRVLKVAKDDGAAERLDAEADALGTIDDHENLVDFIDKVEVGGRRALVLSSAGDRTLADELTRKRGRLSLDLLERWGTNLLSAMVELDRLGVFHRDIKPSNLGVKDRGTKSRKDARLVLFDFSMSGTDLRALAAGTPHYRDPFLGQDGRLSYDSAAERYGAAVVLYEMATGKLPQYGPDADADPSSVPDDVSIDADAFDPAVREDFEAFFAVTLARKAADRHDTAEDMRRGWTNIFARLGRYTPGPTAGSGPVTLDSSLSDAGLSARAVSALESEVASVAELLTLDAVRLNRLVAKEAKETRSEIRGRVSEWRKSFADQLSRRGEAVDRSGPLTSLPDPVRAARLLVDVARLPRSTTRQQAAQLILGLEDGLEPFASQQEVAEAVGRSAPRGHQLIKELQDAWAKDDRCRDLLDQLVKSVIQALTALGGVVTVRTLTDEILAALPDSSATDGVDARRVAAGLLRLALDRYVEHELAETREPLAKRRHGGRLALLARDPALLEAAEAIGQTARSLVENADTAGEKVVPQQRAARDIRLRFTAAFEAASEGGTKPPAITDSRLVRLAAQVSTDAGLSARGELHSLGMPQHTAVRLALAGVGNSEQLAPDELAGRVRARFPDLPALPNRPALDAIVEQADVGLHFDDGMYRPSASAPAATSGLPSRVVSAVPAVTESALARGDHMDRVLAESVRARSFLALGIEVQRPDSVERAVDVLADRFAAQVVDVTSVLIEQMKRVAGEVGLPWDVVRAADAAAPGSRDARGLHTLVERVVPRVTEHLDSQIFGDSAAGELGPVVMTELSPLARYGHLGVIARWSDLAARRARPVWLALPQLAWMRGPVVDGKPLQLASNAQFMELDATWLASQRQEASAG